jgi:hypothetical protein
MINFIYNKIKKYFIKEDFSVSFDSKVKLKTLPEKLPNEKSVFYKLNNDLNYFEVVRIIKNPNLVCIVEIGTDNEYILELSLFNFLFTNVPIPKEIEF